jgi:hypothetical protein
MAKRVQLIQPETGLMKSGYYGFSWTFLFFGWFVPVFRGELLIGLLHLVITVVTFVRICFGFYGIFINYDCIKKNKKYREASDTEKSALRELATELKKVDLAKQNDANELQNLVFQIGKNHGYEKNMREWFLALYQILLGQDQGPRMGSFIALFGVDNFVKLVGERV